MNSLIHKFEKQVLRTDKSGFNSVDNYTIQLSSTADDSLYDLYNSYLELTIEMDVSSGSEAIPAAATTYVLYPIVQPSGMVKTSSVEYQYIGTNGEVNTFTVSDQSQYVPMARAFISMLLDSKALHDQYAGLTEWKYNYDSANTNVNLWDDTISVTKPANSIRCPFKIKLPFRDIIPACNGPSFINLKSLKVNLGWVEPSEFFQIKEGATNGFVYGQNKYITCTNWNITRCECVSSVYLGNINSIDPALRSLQNTVIKHDIIKMKTGDSEYCNTITVPFKTSYLVMYMTDKYGNHKTLKDSPYIKEWHCNLTGNVEAFKTNSNVTDQKDDYWFYILSHCVAEGREYEPLINYQNWKSRFHVYVLPLNEMTPQLAANPWNFQLVLSSSLGVDCQLHLLWLKEGSEAI